MKHKFALLVLGASIAPNASSTAKVAADSTDTESGVCQGADWQAKVAALKELAASLGLQSYVEESIASGKEGDCLVCDSKPVVDLLSDETAVLVAGSPSSAQLSSACDAIKASGRLALVVVDALADLATLMPTLRHLNEHAVQMVAQGAVKMIVTAPMLMVYRFPKADSTTTIAAFADIESDDPLVLAMVRGGNPYKGFESLPGGFLNVQLESLAECAARELMEECFVNDKAKGDEDRFTYRVAASDMVLIDERSRPNRDERGHVVDHGFAWFIPSGKQDEVMAAVNAGDDAKAGSARFVRVSTIKKAKLAFDHGDLLEAALLRLKTL